jgi:crossover junction endodeoxyribonuclease RuvC
LRKFSLRNPGRNGKRVIGVDPGSIFCGYGIIEMKGPHRFTYLVSGRMELNKNTPLHSRLCELFTNLTEIIREYRPHEAVIEKIFYAKGVKAALNLGHARGIALLAASLENLAVYEYSALEVKKSVVGYGRADKNQVKSMVSGILNLRSALSEDSADALALALCHAQRARIPASLDR